MSAAYRYIIGVDEAGCGALAGPLIIAAVAYRAETPCTSLVQPQYGRRKPIIVAAQDSKKIKNPKDRAELGAKILAESVCHVIKACSAAEIDRLCFGPAYAQTLQATVTCCLERLAAQDQTLTPADFVVRIDGDIRPPVLPCAVECIPHGDALDWHMGAASILAKAQHDRHIDQLHERYPDWTFDRHRGYPTPGHKARLRKHGPTPDHRRTFRPVAETLPTPRGIENI